MGLAVAQLDAASGSFASSPTYTVSAGTDRVLIVAVVVSGPDNTQEITGITYGGQTMTLIAQEQIAEDEYFAVVAYALDDAGLDAASGTAVTVSGTWDVRLTMFQSFKNVGQGDPWPSAKVDSQQTASSTPNPLDEIDVDADDNSAVVAICMAHSAGLFDGWAAPINTKTGGAAGDPFRTSFGVAYIDGAGSLVAVEASWSSPDYLAGIGFMLSANFMDAVVTPAAVSCTAAVPSVSVAVGYPIVAPLDSIAAGSFQASLSYTVSAGSDRVLLVSVTQEFNSNPGLPTVTYGGQAMTQIADLEETVSDFNRLTIFFLDDAGITAASSTTIAVGGGVSSNYGIAAGSYENARQAVPVVIDNDVINSSGTNPWVDSTVVNPVSGSYVVSIYSNAAQAETTTWTGATEQLDVTFSTSHRVTWADIAADIANRTANPQPTSLNNHLRSLMSTFVLDPAIQPASVAAVTDVPSVPVSIAPVAVSCPAAVPTATIASAQTLPATVSAPVDIPQADAIGTLRPDSVVAPASVPAPVAINSGSTITVSPVAAVTSVTSVTTGGGTGISPGAANVVSVVPAVITGGGTGTSPAPVNVVASVPDTYEEGGPEVIAVAVAVVAVVPVVTAVGGGLASPATVSVVAAVPSPLEAGGPWLTHRFSLESYQRSKYELGSV